MIVSKSYCGQNGKADLILCVDDQKIHEKMTSITNQGNANQNHNEIWPYLCWNGYHQTDKK